MRHKRGYTQQLDPYTWGGSKAAFVLVDKLKKENASVFIVNKIGAIFHNCSELLCSVQAVQSDRNRLFLMEKIEEHTIDSLQKLKDVDPDIVSYARNAVRANLNKYAKFARLRSKNRKKGGG